MVIILALGNNVRCGTVLRKLLMYYFNNVLKMSVICCHVKEYLAEDAGFDKILPIIEIVVVG